MTDTPRLWDRRANETPKSYAAFLAKGARRSVREAAHQNHIKTTSTGEISSVEDTTVRTWMGWSAKHKWVSRSLARNEWIARASDEQIAANLKACLLALTTRAHDFLTANDAADFLRASFLRASRALAHHFPPVQRVADISERIEDLSDIQDADIERMKAIRTANDAADFLRASFLRASRALAHHFPPVQRVADISERIEDLSDIQDADIERMKAIRDAARAKNEQTNSDVPAVRDSLRRTAN